MSILGAIVRTRPQQVPTLVPRIEALPGVELALDPGDGRLLLVLEDVCIDGVASAAADVLAVIAMWPEVLNTSLVYEYSGPDAPAPDEGRVADYRAWRGSLKDWARPAGAVTGSSPS